MHSSLSYCICFSAMFLLLSFTPEDKGPELTPGKGGEGMQLFTTPMNEIVQKFGREGLDSSTVEIYAAQTDGTCDHQYFQKFVYKEKGMAFISNNAHDSKGPFSLKEIEFHLPAHAHTSQGIVIGTSTMQDVLKAYGKNSLHWDQDRNLNDAFYYNIAGVSFIFDIAPASVTYNKVIGIRIYPKM
jgi:hypothetical protein